MPARGPRRSSLVRGIVCVLVLYHLAAITVANLPRRTAIGAALHAPFSAYSGVFGLDQQWSMFTTIPRFARVDASIVATDERGGEALHGALLPDLAEAGTHLRLGAFFVRLTYDMEAFHADARRYLLSVCRAIERRTGQRAATVRIEIHAETLRRVEDVRED